MSLSERSACSLLKNSNYLPLNVAAVNKAKWICSKRKYGFILEILLIIKQSNLIHH